MTIYYYLKKIELYLDSFSIIPFKSKNIIIGRAQTCDFVIPDIKISRCHAVIQCRDNQWYIQNLSSSGVSINKKMVAYKSEEMFSLGDLIQFGQSPEYLYRFIMKDIEEMDSKIQVNKELKSLSAQQEILESKLQQSSDAKDILIREKLQLQTSFESQKKSLELLWSEKLVQLEKIHQDGVDAHLSLLQEKEHLAEELKNEIKQMELMVENNKTKLEEKLKNEQDVRENILEEKELITAALQAEKNILSEELKKMEEAQAELVSKVEYQAQSLEEKVQLQKKVEKEQQQTAELRKEENALMQQRLQEVQNSLEEKNELTTALKIELKLTEVQAEERLAVLLQERQKLEKLLDKESKNNDEVENLKKFLTKMEVEKENLEAQKRSLEAGPSTGISAEREKIVSSVTNIVENEFQCTICNELFISAITLNCSHTFCKYCIDKWKERKKECPNCRTAIRTETRSVVVDSFIENIVATLSENMKTKRKQFIQEREEEIEMHRRATEAVAAAARIAPVRGRGRGRRRAARRQVSGRRRPQVNARNARDDNLIVPIANTADNPIIIDEVLNNEYNGNDSLIFDVYRPFQDLQDSPSESDVSSFTSEEDDSFNGRYGRCYICGMTDHWADSCPHTDY